MFLLILKKYIFLKFLKITNVFRNRGLIWTVYYIRSFVLIIYFPILNNILQCVCARLFKLWKSHLIKLILLRLPRYIDLFILLNKLNCKFYFHFNQNFKNPFFFCNCNLNECDNWHYQYYVFIHVNLIIVRVHLIISISSTIYKKKYCKIILAFFPRNKVLYFLCKYTFYWKVPFYFIKYIASLSSNWYRRIKILLRRFHHVLFDAFLLIP